MESTKNDKNDEILDKIELKTKVKRSKRYANDPYRANTFIVNCEEPFNAETPSKLLINWYYTPTKLFLKRNHGPIPDLQEKDYKIEINGAVLRKGPITLEEIKNNFKKYHVDAVLTCAGNRRGEMGKIREVDGVTWSGGALGNAQWAGARLCDILDYVKPKSSALHVEFVGADEDDKAPHWNYGSSIPIYKANSPEVLLCYEMNGEALTRDHGFPLRTIVPGYLGARSVKWLKCINFLNKESRNFYQANDYKLFLPSKIKKNISKDDWDKAESIKDLNVNSFICNVYDGEIISLPFTVKGYSISNGNKIWRVDFTYDGGKTWHQAKLFHKSNDDYDRTGKYFGWTLWEFKLTDEIIKKSKTLTLGVRAYDTASNTQPNDLANIWNFRGVMNNSIQFIKAHTSKDAIIINSKF